MKKPYFSIVIPTLNEEKFLPRLLQDLADQIWTDFEVIHVDGNSDDKTVELSNGFKKKLDLRIIPCEIRNVSVQRNLGGDHAKGKWILFFDADNEIDSDFLLGIRYEISKGGKDPSKFMDVFSTLIDLNDRDKKLSKHRVSAHAINTVLTSASSSKNPQAFGALLGVRKELFEKIKFNPKTKFAEDIEFIREYVKKGYKFRIVRKPRFKMSMRRWDDNNLFITAGKAGLLQIQIARGKNKDFTGDEYVMAGGTNYTDKHIK